jgi:transcriptional antiterminator RfaH
MFVRFDIATQGWRAISSTLGVARLVCNGERPASVADSTIARLRESEDASGLIRLVARPELRPGAAVRIINGPFVDCLGLYEGMKDGERIAVLLDLLGRKVRVEIAADFVTAA